MMSFESLSRVPRSLVQAAGLVVFLLAMQQPISGFAAPDPKQEAKAHFRQGQKHYNLSQFAEALKEFKDAYLIQPDPVFLYNIGQCERQLGHLEEANRFYRNYLREQPKAANRQEVERRIDEIEVTLKARAAEANKAEVAPPPASVPPPAPVPAVSTSETRTDLTATPSPSVEATPIYKEWWFWTAVGAVAVGATVGIILATSGKQASPPSTGLGNKGVF